MCPGGVAIASWQRQPTLRRVGTQTVHRRSPPGLADPSPFVSSAQLQRLQLQTFAVSVKD